MNDVRSIQKKLLAGHFISLITLCFSFYVSSTFASECKKDCPQTKPATAAKPAPAASQQPSAAPAPVGQPGSIHNQANVPGRINSPTSNEQREAGGEQHREPGVAAKSIPHFGPSSGGGIATAPSAASGREGLRMANREDLNHPIIHRPVPHFDREFLSHTHHEYQEHVVYEYHTPTEPISAGIIGRGNGKMMAAISGFAAGLAAAALVQHESTQLMAGEDLRASYFNDMGVPLDELKVADYSSGIAAPVVSRPDYEMIKSTGFVLVPTGVAAVTEEKLTLYAPGEDLPAIEKMKRVQLRQDGGQFENQFSFPLNGDSPQGNWRYKVQVFVNKQMYAEEVGEFQVL